ncbi:MAG: hypothetical protein ACLUD0_21140 [Eubacterium ramulus]
MAVTVGKVDFNYNGFATNEGGTLVCTRGRVDFSYQYVADVNTSKRCKRRKR